MTYGFHARADLQLFIDHFTTKKRLVTSFHTSLLAGVFINLHEA